jgi:PAS domain S-box-containing protein
LLETLAPPFPSGHQTFLLDLRLLEVDALPGEDPISALARTIARLPGVDSAGVFEAASEGAEARLLAASGTLAPVEELVVPVTEDIFGFRDQARLWTVASTGLAGVVHPMSCRLDARALLTVPVLSPQKEVIGWISAGSRLRKDFPSDTAGYLQVFSTRAAQEIAHRQRVEELIAERDLYRDFFQTDLFAAIMTFDDGRIAACNQALATLLGYETVEEIKAAGVKDLYLHPGNRRALLDRLRRDGVVSRYRVQLKRRDGSAVNSIVYAQPRFDRHGNHLGTRAILFLDSDQQRIQDRLLEQAALLHTTGEAVIVCQPDRTVKSWNPNAQNLFRFAAESAEGQDLSQLLGELDDLDLEQAWRQVLERDLWIGEFRLRLPQGVEKTVRSQWHLLRDPNGEARSVLMTSVDVTETRALNSALYRTQRLESLGTLAGGIAHDLNNVLTPILMSSNLLIKSVEKEKDRKLLELIVATADRGREMVRQIVWFARGTGGKRSPIRLQSVLQELESVLQHTLPRSVELQTEIAGNLPPVLGDATEIFQALMNLCVNARDSMPSGGQLHLEARVGEIDARSALVLGGIQGKPHISIEVGDTGCGIPESEIERIFDPFFTTKDCGRGSGLGLTTANSIAKGHGGSIEVVSTPGRGTVFRLLLPALEETVVEETPQATPVVPCHGGQRIILVADDDPKILQLTAVTLEGQGYRVLQARDGSEALQIFAESSEIISGVLCDQDMPILDGMKTIRAMSRIDPQVRVLLTTGLPGFTPALDTIEVLPKPWSPYQLLRAVGKLLAEPRAATGNSPPK